MAVQGQESVRRLGNEELVELFRRLHEHLSGNVYCNMAGCIRLRYECVEEDPDPYLPCVKEEPVVERYGFVENVVKELSDYLHSLEELWNTAMDTTELFKQGKASLEQAKSAWTRYWNLVAWLERKLKASKKLLKLALGTPPEEIEQETEQDDPCSKLRETLEEFLER
ncbi:MAG: hypothetical protein F7C36_05440 [Desulfurococcales archaeon]|nr:hypothetical protein [Desulfurococcales archaeon]